MNAWSLVIASGVAVVIGSSSSCVVFGAGDRPGQGQAPFAFLVASPAAPIAQVSPTRARIERASPAAEALIVPAPVLTGGQAASQGIAPQLVANQLQGAAAFPAANVSVTPPHGGQQTGQQVSPEARSDSPASETEADELGSSSSFLEGILGPMAPRVGGSSKLISLNDVMVIINRAISGQTPPQPAAKQVSPEARSDSPASVTEADELDSSSSFLEGILGPMAPRVGGSGKLISLNDVIAIINRAVNGSSK